MSRVLTHIVGCGSISACSATRRDWAVCDACVMGNSTRCDAWEDAAAVRVRVGSPMSRERSSCNLQWLCAMRYRQHRECHARHAMRRQRCTRLCDCACVDTGHSIAFYLCASASAHSSTTGVDKCDELLAAPQLRWAQGCDRACVDTRHFRDRF